MNIYLETSDNKDSTTGGITLSKVSSSEFDPIQEKSSTDIQPTKDTSISNAASNEDTNNRPQSVPVVNPTSTTPVAVNQQYPRPPTTGMFWLLINLIFFRKTPRLIQYIEKYNINALF